MLGCGIIESVENGELNEDGPSATAVEITAADSAEDLGSHAERVTIDCTPWAGESRRLFASLLDMQGVVNAWQGTEVTVITTDRDLVEDLVDQVLATARSAIDPDAPTLVYEVGNWPDALQNEFAAQLTISEVAYIWNSDGDIVVNEADEDLVEEVIDLLPSADSYENMDGLEVQSLLNEVFLVCDRIASKPADIGAVDELRSLSGTLSALSLPFGFEQREWDQLVGSVSQVASDEQQLSHKSRSKAAKSARDRVRQYI